LRWLIPSGLSQGKLDAVKHKDYIGLIMTPRTWHMAKLEKHELLWAGDNDCYSGKFNPAVFTKWLQDNVEWSKRCLFVACPDVIYDAKATLRLFNKWHDIIRGFGYPTAIVLQDGMTEDQIKELDVEAVFLGGSTDWKMGQEALKLLNIAKELGLYRHIGRVNSLKRLRHFIGFADSFDGTDYVFRPILATKMYIPFLMWLEKQGTFNPVG